MSTGQSTGQGGHGVYITQVYVSSTGSMMVNVANASADLLGLAFAYSALANNFHNRIGTGLGWTVQGPQGLTGTVLDVSRTSLQSIDVRIASAIPAIPGVFTFNPPSSSVACFVAGTRILTPNGYKAVETLSASDLVVTSDDRCIPFKRFTTTVSCATSSTAPYLIEPHAFGLHNPELPLRLSPMHKILVGDNLWISPEVAALTNTLVKQYGLGEPVTYYHLECDNYLTDNLISEGTITESFGRNIRMSVWSWDEKLVGFTRTPSNETYATKPVSRIVLR